MAYNPKHYQIDSERKEKEVAEDAARQAAEDAGLAGLRHQARRAGQEHRRAEGGQYQAAAQSGIECHASGL